LGAQAPGAGGLLKAKGKRTSEARANRNRDVISGEKSFRAHLPATKDPAHRRGNRSISSVKPLGRFMGTLSTKSETRDARRKGASQKPFETWLRLSFMAHLIPDT
jgi:hypothetical protein